MQVLHHSILGKWQQLCLPEADTKLKCLPQAQWGRAERIFTPAFWKYQHWINFELNKEFAPKCGLGDTLLEEVVACSLGGHGLPAETSLAYFREFKRRNVAENGAETTEEAMREFLRMPSSSEFPRRFRFWRSKGTLLFLIVTRFRQTIESLSDCPDPFRLRDELRKIPGIGLKTASWISRNWTQSPKIAVIDVHILRALKLLGYEFPSNFNETSYLKAESLFLNLAESIAVPADTLDLLVWTRVREYWPIINPGVQKAS